MADPFGAALRDFHRDEQTEPLRQVDGEHVREHPVERFYFEPRDPDSDETAWLERRLDGPLLDVGAGVGRDARYFQRRFETVALEVSDHLVATMRDRGVDDAVRGDMFALRDSFPRDRFRSVYAHGTQLGLTRSQRGLREFLGDLAAVTTADATAVLDNYDPAAEATAELLGYRDVPDPGVGFRVMHFEYDGDRGDALLFRLFTPDVLRDACAGTGWTVDEIRYSSDHHYSAVLRKR